MFESIIGREEILQLFQTMLAPVLMINGIGLFMLVIQTRYGRVVDRIRIINAEKLALIRQSVLNEISEREKAWNSNRLLDLQEQMSILVRRGKLLKDSLKFMFISIFNFILSSLLLFIQQITTLPVSLVILSCFALGIFLVFVTCINVIKEVANSYNAVMFDVNTYIPKEFSVIPRIEVSEAH